MAGPGVRADGREARERGPVPPQLRVFGLSELGEACATDSVGTDDDRPDSTTLRAVGDGQRSSHRHEVRAWGDSLWLQDVVSVNMRGYRTPTTGLRTP